MLTINILDEPPSADDIRHARLAAFIDGPGTRLMWQIPIPFVDVACATAVKLVSWWNDDPDPETPFLTAEGAIDRDWSVTGVTQRYVAKVHCSGRTYLINLEVQALERYIADSDYRI